MLRDFYYQRIESNSVRETAIIRKCFCRAPCFELEFVFVRSNENTRFSSTRTFAA